jgi:hypothetical protein
MCQSEAVAALLLLPPPPLLLLLLPWLMLLPFVAGADCCISVSSRDKSCTTTGS